MRYSALSIQTIFSLYSASPLKVTKAELPRRSQQLIVEVLLIQIIFCFAQVMLLPYSPQEIFSCTALSLHTVKFELTNQHSVGGKNCGVLTSRSFCALRFDFCVISEVYTVEVRFYFSVFFKFTACLSSVYQKSHLFAIIWTG